MSTLKQIIRLKQQGKSLKQIARICETSRNTVRKYVALSDQSSFTVDELLNMDDQALELALLPVDSKGRDHRYEVLVAQLEHYQEELRRTGAGYCGQSIDKPIRAVIAMRNSVIIKASMLI